MKTLIILILVCLQSCNITAQTEAINPEHIHEDLELLLQNMERDYVYLDDKKVDIACIRETYTERIKQLKTQNDVVLFFEYLLNEFYDSHISLNINTRASYRLWSPLHVVIENEKAIIKNVWHTQIQGIDSNIIGAEIVAFNGIAFAKKITDFPTSCQDKTNPKVRQWLANKILAGTYNKPRVLSLKLSGGTFMKLDIDTIIMTKEKTSLSSKIVDNIGIIRFNNSLGNSDLIINFDKALDNVMETKGLILDLRNTNSGGNTYVARAIMGRFIDRELPYQKHEFTESWDGQPEVVRSWLELASPRLQQYNKPLVILVGRWTGSMGEGLAIGLEAMNRATVVGTEMKRLAGSDENIPFKYQNYGYKLITEKLFHVNGTPREHYVPEHYVKQTTIFGNETLDVGISVLKKKVQ